MQLRVRGLAELTAMAGQCVRVATSAFGGVHCEAAAGTAVVVTMLSSVEWQV